MKRFKRFLVEKFNFRPKTIDEIKSINHPREKELIDLFTKIKEITNDEFEEIVTIDPTKKNGSVKLLRDIEKSVDGKALKKEFSILDSSIFGDGTSPDKTGPDTQQQELITLRIFEEVFSKHSKDYTEFEEMVPELSKIWPNIDVKSSWYKSFKLQFLKIKEKTKLPPNVFDVYNRDGGFMDYISKLISKIGKIKQKDTWNPADIWLINNSEYTKSFKKMIEESSTVAEINDILRKAFTDNVIVGISLKKNNGKELKYDLVNLEVEGDDPETLPKITLDSYKINVSFDNKENNFQIVSSEIRINDSGKIYLLAIRRNAKKIQNVTYEFKGKSGAAQLGKVPMDLLRNHLSELGHKLPTHNDFNKFNKKDWKKAISNIKRSKIFTITGPLDDFVSNLEKSFDEHGKDMTNSAVMQIVQFANIISQLNKEQLNELLKDMFYMSQKKGKKFGPFGKLH